MITFLRALFGWSNIDFSEMESRQRAAQAMRNLTWRRWEKRWVDGF